MHVLLLADGDPVDRAALDRTWPGWADGVELVIAADGGARQAAALGVRIDRWVGDGDSLGEPGIAALADAGVDIRRTSTDKDESDAELGLDTALAAGATRLSVVGALGGPRFDHALANLSMLTRPDLGAIDVRLLAGDARSRLLTAPRPGDDAAVHVDLPGPVGDLVTLLPVGADALGVTTHGFRYPLLDEPLRLGRTRGLSNVRADPAASVTLRSGRLLVVEVPATLRA